MAVFVVLGSGRTVRSAIDGGRRQDVPDPVDGKLARRTVHRGEVGTGIQHQGDGAGDEWRRHGGAAQRRVAGRGSELRGLNPDARGGDVRFDAAIGRWPTAGEGGKVDSLAIAGRIGYRADGDRFGRRARRADGHRRGARVAGGDDGDLGRTAQGPAGGRPVGVGRAIDRQAYGVQPVGEAGGAEAHADDVDARLAGAPLDPADDAAVGTRPIAVQDLADVKGRRRRHAGILRRVTPADAVAGGGAGDVGAVAVVVVGCFPVPDKILEGDDLAVIELLVARVGAGVQHADAHRLAADRPRAVDGEVEGGVAGAEIGDRPVEVRRDLEILLDAEDSRRVRQGLDLRRRHRRREAVDDAELARHGEAPHRRLGRGRGLGQGKGGDDVELVAGRRLVDLPLQGIGNPIAVLVRQDERRRAGITRRCRGLLGRFDGHRRGRQRQGHRQDHTHEP